MRLRSCLTALVAGIVVLGGLAPPPSADGGTIAGRYGRARVRVSTRLGTASYLSMPGGSGIILAGAKASINLGRRTATATAATAECTFPSRLEDLPRSAFPVAGSDVTADYAFARNRNLGGETEDVLRYSSEGEPLAVTVTRFARMRPDREGNERCRIAGRIQGTMRRDDIDSTLPGPDTIQVRARFSGVFAMMDLGGL